MFKNFLKKIGLFKIVKFLYKTTASYINILRNVFSPTGIILAYHRVAKLDHDPFQLAVSTENFREQMSYLKDNYQIISLEELVTAIKNKAVKRNMMVVTFDDGYADNLYNALPILEELNIPATVFISSGNINRNFFYWDENPTSDYGRPITSEELKKLCTNNLIIVGGHTLSHLHIPILQKNVKIKEIVEDRNNLQIFCEKSITTFSFPFGEFDNEAIEIVKEAGYSCSCVLKEQRVSNNSDVFRLPRFLVRNWNRDTFIQKINSKFL